jgi:PAS domain S-box-containing protein
MPKEKTSKIPYHLIIIFFLLSICIWIAGYLYYEHQREYIKKEKQDELSAIADLKIRQILNWRKERMADAEIIFNNPLIVPHIKQGLESGASGLKQEILTYVKSLQEHYQYKSVILLDTKGDIRLAVPGGKESLGPDAKRFTMEAIRTKKVFFSDLYKSKITNVIRLSLVIPLLISQGHDTIPVGVLLLRSDPYEFLYSLIQSWPTPSNTAETVLVRREGENVIFLNELRHRKDTALTLRFPITEKQLPEAMAARGIEGVTEGIDYRGVPVLAVMRAIPDSPWFLVAKIDKEEIYAPIRERFQLVTIIVILLIGTAGVSVGLFWRHQRAVFYRKQYEAEVERIVERKRSEETLRALSSRQTAILAAVPDIIMEVDVNKIYTWANKAGFEFFGEDVIGKEAAFYFKGEQETYESVRPIFNGKENVIYVESWQRRKDGEKRLLAWWCKVLKNTNGNVIGALSTARDITERKQAEANLVNEKNFIDSAIDSLPGVFYVFDENGRLLRWNRNLEIVSGYSDEEIQKMNPLDFFAGEEKKLAEDAIKEVFLKGESNVEANLISKDGGKRLYFFTGLRFILDNQNYLIGTGIDISELKEAEKSLEESEKTMRGLLNANPESISLIDTNGIVLAANETTAKRLGKNTGELIGHYVYDLIPTEAAEKRKPYIDEVIQTGNPVRFEDVRTGIYFDNYIQPIFDDKGNVTKIAILAVDITHRKHAEEEIRTLNAELEQRVRDRTAQFEAANKELEAFSYSVSHDLRAPLRAIDGFTHAIIEDYADKFDEEGKRLLDIVSSNAQKMGQLIDDLLTFSRTGRQELRMSKIEMDTLARTVFEELKAAAPERTIQFAIKPLPLAHGDQGMIRQVFVNLLSNAIKFTRPKETAIIEVGGWRGDKDNPPVPHLEKLGEEGFEEIPPEQNIYYVKDNGVGFDMQYVNKLFSVFQRLHSESEFEGTGVGLAIVKRIIQRHGGQVWAEGKVNEGATFYFSLPRKDYSDKER